MTVDIGSTALTASKWVFIYEQFRHAISVTLSCPYHCIIVYYSAIQTHKAASVLNRISCQLLLDFGFATVHAFVLPAYCYTCRMFRGLCKKD